MNRQFDLAEPREATVNNVYGTDFEVPIADQDIAQDGASRERRARQQLFWGKFDVAIFNVAKVELAAITCCNYG